MTFRIVLTCFFVVDVIWKLAKIGEPRVPSTAGDFWGSLVLYALIIYGIWRWI